MVRTRWRVFATVLVAFAIVAAACGGDDDSSTTTTAASAGGEAGTTAPAPPEAEPLKVAFVHVGPVADKGWSWAHDQGAQFLKAQLGDAVEITTLESIPEGSDAQRVFEDLAASGNKLIFGTSFGYMDPMLAAAENFPNTVYHSNSGPKRSHRATAISSRRNPK